MNVFKWLFTIDLFKLNKHVLKQEAERKLRDELADKAMQGLLASWGQHTLSRSEIAKTAYKMADAMLAEREKKNE